MDDPMLPRQPDPGFVEDCRAAIRCWRSAPALPIMSAAYQLAWVASGRVSEPWSPIVVLALVLTVGWPGVQRAWYQRLDTGDRLAIGEIPRLLRRYFRRFFTLGAWMAAVMVVPVLVLLGVSRSEPVVARLSLIAIAICFDVVLTFVTPALALTTPDLREGRRIGFALLRETWPACALYALVPPIAVELIFYGLHNGPARLLGAAIGALFALICKGATLRFYVRREDAGDTTWQPIDRSLEL